MRVVPVLLSALLLLAGGCDPAPAPAPGQPPDAAVPHRLVGYFTMLSMILNVAHTPPDTADVPLLPALPAHAGGEDSN